MGLTVRMLLALALACLLWLTTLAGLVWLVITFEWGWLAVLLVLGFAGDGWVRQTSRRRSPRSRQVVKGDTPRAKGAVQRLSLVAGIKPPRAVVDSERAPLSWTIWPLGGEPRVHVTTGLLDRLDDRQLEAVVAHELMHVANRDAKLMTLIGAMPAFFFSGMRDMIDENPVTGYVSVLLYGLWFTPTAALLLATARIVSRHRERVADAGAAELVGSPAAVAGALVALSDELGAMRDQDLRRARTADLFHFVPARRQGRLFATHPPLRERLDRLQRMERELQG